MKFATAISAALLAGAALAAPRPSSAERLKERIARRSSGIRKTTPPKFITGNTNGPENTDADQSTNWSGVVYKSVPDGTAFTAVSATFVVPEPQSTGGGGSQAASAWVGIDGDTCGSAILQTGVDFNVQGSDVSYDAWYEWFPDYAYDFDGISFNTGDTVSISVVASSSTSGTAYITNESNGQSVSQPITSSSALCQTNAEWIVEDFEEGSSLVPFANFGTVDFTNAVAQTSGGSSIGPGSGTQIVIVQNGQQLTSVSSDSDSVTVSYQ